MALDGQRRREVAVALAKELGLTGSKPELIALIAGVDAWCDDNAVSYNASVAQPYRSALTSVEKARLLAAVAVARVS